MPQPELAPRANSGGWGRRKVLAAHDRCRRGQERVPPPPARSTVVHPVAGTIAAARSTRRCAPLARTRQPCSSPVRRDAPDGYASRPLAAHSTVAFPTAVPQSWRAVHHSGIFSAVTHLGVAPGDAPLNAALPTAMHSSALQQ